MTELNKIALKIISDGKGILAADESNGTMTKRLEAVNVPNKGSIPEVYFSLLFQIFPAKYLFYTCFKALTCCIFLSSTIIPSFSLTTRLHIFAMSLS